MERKTCPTCGADIDADHPQGLCPACLLKGGLPSERPIGEARPRCAACQSRLGEDARFCAHCGAAVPLAPTAEGDPVRTALETKLQGQYRLVRLLGRGGMGAVYLARDLTLEREVAIKVVKTDSDAPEVYDRLRREAKTAARLSHPNIVPLHAFGEVEGMPYFVMGYVRGEALGARLRRDGKLPEDEARRILAEIADALDHAHRQGVVHRDIKPDNVLLEDDSGRALLTDFGVARALGKGDTLTRAGSVVGTPHYMSPEQAAGRADLDGRSDIYSLGVMAYAMLSGRLPFEGSTPADILTKHLTQEPPPLRSIAPTLSDSTVQAVERCLAKDPARRWPDARSLKLAMGTLEEGQLPDGLQAVQGQGITFTAIATLLLLLLWLIVVQMQKAPPLVLLLNGGMIALIYVVVTTRLRLEGFSISQSQRAIWTEPSWWPFWYPRAARRAGNVWERLPAEIRYVRWSIPVFWMYFALCAYEADRFFTIKVISLVAITAIVVSLEVRSRSVLKRKGIAPADIERIIFSVPPSRVSFWARPHITAVLAPATRTEPSRRSDSPHDQLRSILRHADELSGPLRPLGAGAAVAARQLIASIEHADREIAELARNLEPGEEERLAEKIAALAPAPGASDDSAPMRVLLEKQLELIRGLSGRIEEARERRSRRVEILKTLALHLAALRARQTPTEVRSLSDRVRALCDDIGRQAAAPTEARAAAGDEIDEKATLDRTPNDRKTHS